MYAMTVHFWRRFVWKVFTEVQYVLSANWNHDSLGFSMIQPVYKWVSKIKQQQQQNNNNQTNKNENKTGFQFVNLFSRGGRSRNTPRVLNTPGEIIPTTSDCRENGDTV